MKKGILMFYINFVPDSGVTVEQTTDLFRSQNKELLEKLKAAGDYEVMFVPTVKEATRVEKVDFDQPYPRFIPMQPTNDNEE